MLFLDACALIYRFEGGAPFRDACVRLLGELAAQQPGSPVAVSRLSVLECRVKPLREGDTALLARYESFFSACHIVELSAAVVERATALRVRHGLKTPDALQAASALALPAPVCFVTGDAGFARIAELDVRLIVPSA
jgi:predicted nucleic acid-binding protein